MRTTIELDDRIFRAFKERAASRGTTFAREVEEALRSELHARRATEAEEPFELPVFEGEPALELVEEATDDPAPFGLSDPVLTAFIRIVTNARAFKTPTPLDVAFDVTNRLMSRSNARLLEATEASWPIFERLSRQTQAKGKLVADARHAALAIEHGCQWISFDRDFAKFPGLEWRHLLDS